MTPRAARQLRPVERASSRRPARRSATGGPIKHVFYIVRENRTYDQVLGDDPRGDGDPKLTLFGERHHAERARARQALPAARPRLRELRGVDRRPLLDGGRLVSDYVVKNWHQNYAGRGRPVRLRRLRGHLAVAGLPVRPGREAGHLVLQLRRGGRRASCRCSRQGPHAPTTARGEQEVRQVRPRRAAARPLLPERRLLGRRQPADPAGRVRLDACRRARRRRRESRFDCFKTKFTAAARDEQRAGVQLHGRCRTTTRQGTAPGPAHAERDDRRQRLRRSARSWT